MTNLSSAYIIVFSTLLFCNITSALRPDWADYEDPMDGPTQIEMVANAASYADVPVELSSLMQYPHLFGLSPTQVVPLPKVNDLVGAELHGAALLAKTLGLRAFPRGSPNAIDNELKKKRRRVRATAKEEEEGPYSLKVPRVGLFEAPPVKIEHAVGEEPLWINKGLEFKEGIQSFVAGVVQPKPIVDTIKEEDKYGNSGEKLRGVSNAVVRGYEGISRFTNSILEGPKNFFQNLQATINDKLNNFGAKIGGL